MFFVFEVRRLFSFVLIMLHYLFYCFLPSLKSFFKACVNDETSNTDGVLFILGCSDPLPPQPQHAYQKLLASFFANVPFEPFLGDVGVVALITAPLTLGLFNGAGLSALSPHASFLACLMGGGKICC